MPSKQLAAAESQKAELILSQLDSLPPLAPVATRILALTDDSESNVKEIIELVESDPALTAKILSMLGRSEHGVRQELITVRNAVLMLGFGTIRQMTIAIKIMDVFGTRAEEADSSDFDQSEFWRHCLGVACAARRVAMTVSSAILPEEAFVMGLLHDLGKNALHVTMPKSFAQIVRTCRQTRAEITDVERAVLGLDHTAVGHRLADRWGLPQKLIECIWLHHQAPDALPASIAAGKHVQIVHLADTLVREHKIGFSGNDRVAISSRDLAAGLGLPEADRSAIVESLAEEIESRATWIGAEEIRSTEVYLRALMRSTEDLSLANAALSEQNRRLHRKADHFAALGWLNQAVSPKASVQEVCGAGAEAMRRALSVPAILVCAVTPEEAWVKVGFSAGSVSSKMTECPFDGPEISGDVAMALQAAMAGSWMIPPSRAFDELVDPYRDKLGGTRIWLLPLVREQRWLGGAFFHADDEAVTRLRSERAEIEALSAAVGLAIAQSQAKWAAIALSDELADANRRLFTTQGKLLRTKTLQTVVAMAAGAAHELNNPLAVISGRAQMLRNQTEDPAMRELLDTITKKANVCSNIVTELMSFAEPPQPSPEKVALQELLESLRKELSDAGLLDAAAVTVEVPSDTPPVLFDRQQLTRVFRELIQNAVEATDPSSRRLTIKAIPDLTEENLVVVVDDNGCGMDPEVEERAMDPFFSHRTAGRGRGLGLARVLRWMQEGDGTIRIESRPGEGTRVELRFPVACSSATV